MVSKQFLRARNALGWAVVLASVQGCSNLAQPFDRMKNSPMTVYRLQNFEPPAATAAAPNLLPPQIQSWITAGAALLPPGLLPPGLVPGTAAAPVQQNAPKFHDFRILGWANLTTSSLRDDTLDVFGHESNFETAREACMYAEFGVSIGQDSQPPADILISLSCDQVRPFNFVWPYTKYGLGDDATKKIVSVMQRAFGGG